MKQYSKVINKRSYKLTGALSGYHPVLQRILHGRGIKTDAQMTLTLSALPTFALLTGIDEAIRCLVQALQADDHITIIGDYDADGATSTALAIKCLRAFGAKHVSYMVPNRFEYGYGLTPKIVDAVLPRAPRLLVTVDNGITSVEGVDYAKQHGIPVIITDHHLPGEVLPAAAAIVNPNQKDCAFPCKNLAGVGVIFYLMLALRARLRECGWFAERSLAEPNIADVLDLVALGTVADVVVLDDINRRLVQQGLKRARAGRASVGFNALCQVAGRDVSTLRASDLGFALAPRLNAAGRLEDMSLGIECLLATDPNVAYEQAKTLSELNETRKTIEQDMKQDAYQALQKIQVTDGNVPNCFCLYGTDWHQGVIGILAGRLKDKYHRPVIAFADADESSIKGSARSIAGCHIRDVLADVASAHPELIEKYGGHAMAAGLTIQKKHFAAFKKAFEQCMAAHLTDDLLQELIYTDGELSEADFTIDLARELQYAVPWGQGFPEPLFQGQFEIVEQRLVGERHLKLTVKVPGTSLLLSAIHFNADLHAWPDYDCTRMDCLYRLDINEYRGLQNLQLIISDVVVKSTATMPAKESFLDIT